MAELQSIGATGSLSGNAIGTIGAGNGEQAGVSSPDLRRLGLARTLTLVNGRHHVAAVAGSSQVDLATIPSALVKRIDVVTGGASAVYGSGAVSGVVNVILKDDYEGVEVNVSGANSLEGVNSQNYSVSGVAGFNFAQDKGNVTFFASHDDIETTTQRDIRQFQAFGTIANQDDTGENDCIPDRLVVPNIASERINRTGVLNPFGGGVGLVTFLDDGTPIDQQRRTGINSFAFGSFPNGCDTCCALEDFRSFLPEVERNTIGTTFNYDFTDSVTAYGSVKYVKSDIIQLGQPIFRFGNVSIDVEDNAFLDADLRQRLLDAGQVDVPFAILLDELGQRFAANEREMLQYDLGVKGNFELAETELSCVLCQW